MRDVTDPVAVTRIRWMDDDLRPPAGSTVAATAVFVHGCDDQVIPNWPAGGEHFSVLLTLVESADDAVTAKVDFLDRAAIAEYLREGAAFLVMAGPKPVAEARITAVLWRPDA